MRWWWVVLLFACAPQSERAQATDSMPVTEPEFVTDEDTLGPEPVEPAFQLAGTEPFWGLRVDSTGLWYSTPDDSAGKRFAFTRAVLHGDSLRWNSLAQDGTPIEAVVVRRKCSDGMSDIAWEYSGRVTLGAVRYDGCARPLTASR